MNKPKSLVIKDKVFDNLCDFLTYVFSDIYLLADLLETVLKVIGSGNCLLLPKVLHVFCDSVFFKGTVKVLYKNLDTEVFDFYGFGKYLVVQKNKSEKRWIFMYSSVKNKN